MRILNLIQFKKSQQRFYEGSLCILIIIIVKFFSMVVQNEEVELMSDESDVEIEGSKLKFIESQLNGFKNYFV